MRAPGGCRRQCGCRSGHEPGQVRRTAVHAGCRTQIKAACWSACNGQSGRQSRSGATAPLHLASTLHSTLRTASGCRLAAFAEQRLEASIHAAKLRPHRRRSSMIFPSQGTEARALPLWPLPHESPIVSGQQPACTSCQLQNWEGCTPMCRQAVAGGHGHAWPAADWHGRQHEPESSLESMEDSRH